MGLADVVLICYALGSAMGLLGLIPRCRELRKPAAWAIAAGFVAHTLIILHLFVVSDIDTLSRGDFLEIMAWGLVFVYCVTWWRLRFSILGLTAGPLALLLFFGASAMGNIKGGLPQAMTGAFFVLHLVVLFSNLALITLGLGSALYFLNLHRKLKARSLPTESDVRTPALATVDRINRLVVLWGFPLFTVGLATGFAWAHATWGGVFRGDPKEVVSILIWLLYSLIFMQRFVLGWQGKKAALMLIVLFAVTVLSMAGVNFFMDSHHNYFQVPVFEAL